MADINHAEAPVAPTEGDGVSYAGIFWFVVILTVTTVVCQVLMWGLFVLFDAKRQDTAERAPLAAPAVDPRIQDGRIVSGSQLPEPAMLTSEPTALEQFRQREEAILHGYGWVDEKTGTARIPIDRAKELLLERGLPVKK